MLGSVALGLAGVAWALVRCWRLAAIGSGYKAKILCTAVFAPATISTRVARRRSRRTLLDSCGSSERTSTAIAVPVLFRWWCLRPGSPFTATGWAARSSRSTHNAQPSGDTSAGRDRPHRTSWTVAATPWPLGKAVELAFTEPNPKRLRRTRAVVVAQHGRLIAERYAPGFDRDSPFAGWSLSKSVMSALMGILIGEGRMSLQDAALWPGWRAPDPRASISIEALLRMRSGLRFSEGYSDLSSAVIEMLFSAPDVGSYAVSRPRSLRPEPSGVHERHHNFSRESCVARR